MTNEALRNTAAIAAISLLLVVGGCTDKASPDNVDRRAVERWNFLIEHKAEKAYDYLSPGYRTTQDRETYAGAMNNRPVQWTKATFNRKDCEAERCTVQVDVNYSVPMASVPGKTTSSSSSLLTETWVLIDGEWYFLPK